MIVFCLIAGVATNYWLHAPTTCQSRKQNLLRMRNFLKDSGEKVFHQIPATHVQNLETRSEHQSHGEGVRFWALLPSSWFPSLKHFFFLPRIDLHDQVAGERRERNYFWSGGRTELREARRDNEQQFICIEQIGVLVIQTFLRGRAAPEAEVILLV